MQTERIGSEDSVMNVPDYLTQHADGFVRLTGHRIGLEDVIFFYHEGYSPEMLLGQFPTLSLALIHKTIAFYLENQEEVDRYLSECDTEVARQRAAARKGPSLADLRQRMGRNGYRHREYSEPVPISSERSKDGARASPGRKRARTALACRPAA